MSRTFRTGDWVLVEPRPEDRSGEWFCHPVSEWEQGDYSHTIYCPESILDQLAFEGYPVIRYDLGGFEVDGQPIYLDIERHIPYTLNRRGHVTPLSLEILRRFVGDSPQRYIGDDGIEYEYWYAPADYRFLCLNLTDVDLEGVVMDCTEVLLREFKVRLPELNGPDGLDDDGVGGDEDAVGALEDEFSNPIQVSWGVDETE